MSQKLENEVEKIGDKTDCQSRKIAVLEEKSKNMNESLKAINQTLNNIHKDNKEVAKRLEKYAIALAILVTLMTGGPALLKALGFVI